MKVLGPLSAFARKVAAITWAKLPKQYLEMGSQPDDNLSLNLYRGTSLIRSTPPVEPYSRPLLRDLW